MRKGSILSNPKHERFAQELAKGKTADEAYKAAGYSQHRGNASRMSANESILARVSEIQRAAAVRTEITIQSLTDMLVADRDLARSLGQAAAAKGCVDSLAKLHGLFIDKHEVGHPGDFERMSDQELDEFIAAGVQELGISKGRARRRTDRVH